MDEQVHAQAAIPRLLQKMDGSPGFAGLGAAIQTINSFNDDDGEGSRNISTTILQDAALTAKLLRLSNSSGHARGGRNVSTVDQAIAVLGLNTVKSVALSLALLNSLSNKPQSKKMHGEIVAAYFCGILACELTRLNGGRYSSQEAQVCGLLQNLGRMMASYYLYEDIERSHELMAGSNLAESEAVLPTLGVSYEQIGHAIAEHWSLPDVLLNSMHPAPLKAPPRGAPNAFAWYQYCSIFSRRVTEAVFRLPEKRERVEIGRHIDFFREALRLREDEARELIARCLEETGAALSGMAFPCDIGQARDLLRKESERVTDVLSSKDSLAQDSAKLNGRAPIEAIQHVLRLIHDKYHFDHTLVCLPEGPNRLEAVAGVGKNAAAVISRFRFDGDSPDLFRAVQKRRLDTFIADVRLPVYAKLVPQWYHEVVGAATVVLLPLEVGGKCIGLVCCDYLEVHDSAPPGLAQGDMRKWRDLLTAVLLQKRG
jgi:HD-like signal output (HDOD) protein